MAVFIPDRDLKLKLSGAGVAIAMATEGSTSAVTAVVTATGVEAIEEHILEAERLGNMAAVSRSNMIVAGTAFDAIFPSSDTCVFTMRRLVLIQTIGGVSGRGWVAMTAVCRSLAA